MKPLFWKELRQLLKWAIAALAVMSAAAVYFGWLSSRPDWSARFFGFGWYAGQITPFEQLQALSAVGCALAGLLLGVLHAAAEKRRDLWVFLAHRPHSRTTIFFAKASAGLLLYLGAVSLPLAAVTAWLAVPGRVAAPFYWPMVLPGVADILTGGVYYLAGLLIAMREARWYGSRALAVAVAIICSAVVTTVPEFWIALIAILVAAGILGAAAWGSFLAGGHDAPQPWWARSALGASLLAGIAIVLAFSGTLLMATQGMPEGPWSSYHLTPEGAVMQVVHGRWGQVLEITDLAGQRREDLEQEALKQGYWYTLFLRFVGVIVPDERYRGSPYAPAGYREARRFYQQAALRRADATVWVYSLREQLFVAFDAERKHLVGRLGPDGFTAEPARPPRRFRAGVVALPAQGGLLAFNDVVYELKGRARRIEQLYTASPGEQVLTICDLRPWQHPAIVVVTDRAVRFISPDSGQLVATGVEHDLGRYGVLEFALTEEPPRFYVWYKPSYWLDAEAYEMPSHLIAHDPDGAVLARHELPATPLPRDAPGWRDSVVALTLPLAFVVTAFVVAQGQPVDWPFGPEGGAQMIVLLVLIGLLAAGCAAATVVLARRNAWGRGARWGWTTFNFLVGPAGLLLLWALRDWPARVPCPACGRKRVVDREHCAHCRAAFPPRAPDGTEIFEGS
jgi:hypothetical protein